MIGNTQQLNPIFGFMSSFQSNGLLIDVNCDSQFNRVDGFDIYKTKPIYINKKNKTPFTLPIRSCKFLIAMSLFP